MSRKKVMLLIINGLTSHPKKNDDVGRYFGAIRGNEYGQKPRRSEGREYGSFQNDWIGNRQIRSNSNGNQTLFHQTPGVNIHNRNLDVHQQFPGNPYVGITRIHQTRQHDYQYVKIGGFQSGRNENYLECGAQYQAISSDNVNDGEPGKLDLFEGTLEELDKVCKESNMKVDVQILRLLEENGIVVNLPRYLLLLKACAKAKALVEPKAVHEHLVRSKSLLDISTCNDIMITWLAKNGVGEDVIDMFSQFRESVLKPDGQMFIGVFTACASFGDVTEGMLYFDSMSKVIQGKMELGNRCSEIVEELNPSHLSKESKAGLIAVTASVVAPKEETKK
ncbi:hypothetical protein Dimus_004109 [Dionaea muscipula]